MIVEIDVLLPKETSLPMAHDLCEMIQYTIEALEGINRACELHPLLSRMYVRCEKRLRGAIALCDSRSLLHGPR